MQVWTRNSGLSGAVEFCCDVVGVAEYRVDRGEVLLGVCEAADDLFNGCGRVVVVVVANIGLLFVTVDRDSDRMVDGLGISPFGGWGLCCFWEGLFPPGGGVVIEAGVQSRCVVPVDPGKDRSACVSTCCKDLSFDAFAF